MSIWYWHFVDVVWIFLFLMLYWWGNEFDSEFFEKRYVTFEENYYGEVKIKKLRYFFNDPKIVSFEIPL